MNKPFLFKARGRLVDFMRQADEPGLINLAAGVPATDSLPVEDLRAAFEKVCADDGARLFAYHHPEGDHRLRALFAERLVRRGVKVEGRQVLATTGCQQALQIMLSLLIRPGDIVACQSPAYYALLELIAANGALILPLPERGAGGFDVAEVAELLGRWRPKCLFVCTTLSNPSGSTMPEAARVSLVEVCRRLGVRIIEDDIYAELVDGGAPKPMIAFDDGSTVSYVTSFSKSVSPGLRAGFCVPGTLFEEAATLKCQEDMHGSVLSEGTLRAYLEMGSIEAHLARLRERNRRRRVRFHPGRRSPGRSAATCSGCGCRTQWTCRKCAKKSGPKAWSFVRGMCSSPARRPATTCGSTARRPPSRISYAVSISWALPRPRSLCRSPALRSPQWRQITSSLRSPSARRRRVWRWRSSPASSRRSCRP
jgi:aspartate/methionine/tyrosine aminotransferase